MNKLIRIIFCFAAAFAVILSGCASKPAAIQEIIQSSDTMAVTLYGYDIGGGSKAPSSYVAAINVKDGDESVMETIPSAEEAKERFKEIADQYQTIWNTFGTALVQYLKSTGFKETAQEPGNDDLAFMVETPSGANVYFYRSNMVKIVGDQTVCYSVSNMDTVLEALSTAAKANSELFSFAGNS